jgi:MFS family permease
MVSSAREAPPSGIEALRVREYRLLWVASAVWEVVSVMQTVAVVWIIFSLTGSATWVSLMVSSAILPTLIVSVPAGVLADAMSRRILLLVSTLIVLGASIGLLVLWVADIATPSSVVLLGMVRGIGVGLFNPAWSAIFPFIVPRRMLSGALALMTASAGVAMVASAYVGGLVADLDPGWALAVAVAGYLVVALIFVGLRVDEGSFVRTPFLIATSMGLRHVRYSAATHPILVFGATFGFLSAGIRSVLPNLVDTSFSGEAELYGLMLAAFGLGLVVGGGLREFADHLARGRIVTWGCAGFGVAGIVAATATTPPTALFGLFLSGLAWTWVLSTLGIRYLMMTPDWVRARALGVYHLAVFGAFGLGGVAAGLASDRFGERASILSLSIAAILSAWAARAVPGPVDLDGEDEAAPDGDVDGPTAGPVLVVERWAVGEQRVADFWPVLGDLRAVRLRTGAMDWRSFLDPDEPGTVIEQFRLHSSSEAARQESRYDRHDRAVLGRAELFRYGPPVRRELPELAARSERSYLAIPPSSSRTVIPR